MFNYDLETRPTVDLSGRRTHDKRTLLALQAKAADERRKRALQVSSAARIQAGARGWATRQKVAKDALGRVGNSRTEEEYERNICMFLPLQRDAFELGVSLLKSRPPRTIEYLYNYVIRYPASEDVHMYTKLLNTSPPPFSMYPPLLTSMRILPALQSQFLFSIQDAPNPSSRTDINFRIIIEASYLAKTHPSYLQASSFAIRTLTPRIETKPPEEWDDIRYLGDCPIPNIVPTIASHITQYPESHALWHLVYILDAVTHDPPEDWGVYHKALDALNDVPRPIARRLAQLVFNRKIPMLDLVQKVAFGSPALTIKSLFLESFQSARLTDNDPRTGLLLGFIKVLSAQLVVMLDNELFNIYKNDLESISKILTRLLYYVLADRDEDDTCVEPLASILRQLRHRNDRECFLKDWTFQEAKNLLNVKSVFAIERDRFHDTDDIMDEVATLRTSGQLLARVMTHCPHALEFDTRVAMMYTNINGISRPNYRGYEPTHTVRRNFLLEDAILTFSSDEIENDMKIAFVNELGVHEPGMDGGGLLKDLLSESISRIFDPGFGLFERCDDGTYLPYHNASLVHNENALSLFKVAGKMVGKMVFEKALIRPLLNRTFINHIIGIQNQFDDLESVDVEVFRNLRFALNTPNVEDLCLTMTVTEDRMGSIQTIDLVPNGSNIPVSKANRHKYAVLMAHYRITRRIKDEMDWFTQGLKIYLREEWLRLFTASEVSEFLSGSKGSGFNVSDLRANCGVHVYTPEDRTLLDLWDVLEEFSDSEKSLFLQFVTSCPRPPLLGFKQMYPLFGITRVEDPRRLPTASTCANLLQLPDYKDKDLLRTQLLKSIKAPSAFNLE